MSALVIKSKQVQVVTMILGVNGETMEKVLTC